jgi:hypothetical protein
VARITRRTLREGVIKKAMSAPLTGRAFMALGNYSLRLALNNRYSDYFTLLLLVILITDCFHWGFIPQLD